MDWENFSFIILHHAWDVLRKREPLSDDIKEFILRSLRLEPPPPATILANCLLVIGLVLGVKLYINDLLVVDNWWVYLRVNCEMKLTCPRSQPPDQQNLREPHGGVREPLPYHRRDRPRSGIYGAHHSALRKLRHPKELQLVPPCHANSRFPRQLLGEVGGLPSHHARYLQMGQTLHGSRIRIPHNILTFLDHHFDLATRGGQNYDEPIQNALRVLAYASGPVTIEALKRFDLTEPSSVRGIYYVFQDNKPFQLRRAALLFPPLIDVVQPSSSDCGTWSEFVRGLGFRRRRYRARVRCPEGYSRGSLQDDQFPSSASPHHSGEMEAVGVLRFRPRRFSAVKVC